MLLGVAVWYGGQVGLDCIPRSHLDYENLCSHGLSGRFSCRTRSNSKRTGGRSVLCFLIQVRYEWLKDLLPRLHVVDVHMLSSSGEVDRNIEEKPTAVTVSEEENPTIPAGMVTGNCNPQFQVFAY